MPHKHKRRKVDEDSIYDLPPTTRAKPLPPGRQSKKGESASKSRKSAVEKNNVSAYKEDDTPRAFARLMAFAQKKGQRETPIRDDGNEKKKSTKKRKHGAAEPNIQPSSLSTKDTQSTNGDSTKSQLPKIQPGESLRDFAARVDVSLPLANVSTSNAASRSINKSLGIQEKMTRHNKKLQNKISRWREEDVRIKEKEQEDAEEAELDEVFDEDEDGTKREMKQLWEQTRLANRDKKGKKLRAKKQRSSAAGATGEVSSDSDDDDPWSKLTAKKLAETKQRNLQDVVEAPPTLKLPGAKLKAVENVPKGNATSLRRREELAKERERFLADWRKMKGQKTR